MDLTPNIQASQSLGVDRVVDLDVDIVIAAAVAVLKISDREVGCFNRTAP
jgi:hypothetical protein